jgi:hypothetical protein
MAAGTTPIYVAAPRQSWSQVDGDGGAAGPLKTQNTALDGTGTVLTVFTANATNGSIVTHLTARPTGTNIATVMRIFLNNGSTNATLGNNSLIDEMTLNATTASAVAALQPYVWTPPSGILRLPASYKVMVTLGTTVAAGYVMTAFGGDF